MATRRMGNWRGRLALAVSLAGLAVVSARARGDDPEPPAMAGDPGDPAAHPPGDEGGPPELAPRIAKAVEAGVAWLRKAQRTDGSWGDMGSHAHNYNGGEEVYQYPAGPTALALYALLKCRVPPDDPGIVRGFAWLRGTYRLPKTAYEASVLLLAVTSTADPFKRTRDARAAAGKVRISKEMGAWARDLRDLLMSYRAPRGWRYYGPTQAVRGGNEDVSSTQLAVLALYAADRCGIPVEPKVWKDAIDYVRTLQEATGPEVDRAVRLRAPAAPPPGPAPDPRYAPPAPTPSQKDHARGFIYSSDPGAVEEERSPTGGRTACGVGTLAIADAALAERPAKAGDRAALAVDREAVRRSILDGLAWIAEHWSPWDDPRSGIRPLYWLYGLERAMDLVGAERLGEHLWYREMAEQLLGRQAPNGPWDTTLWGDRSAVLDTSLALLFLHRSTRGALATPVVTGDDADPK